MTSFRSSSWILVVICWRHANLAGNSELRLFILIAAGIFVWFEYQVCITEPNLFLTRVLVIVQAFTSVESQVLRQVEQEAGLASFVVWATIFAIWNEPAVRCITTNNVWLNLWGLIVQSMVHLHQDHTCRRNLELILESLEFLDQRPNNIFLLDQVFFILEDAVRLQLILNDGLVRQVEVE